MACEGLDPSKEIIGVAKAKIGRSDRIRSGTLRIATRCTKKDTFDCVVTVYTLRNFADSQLAIWQMMRVLKPGGKLVFVVDAFSSQNPAFAKMILKFWLEYIMPIVALIFIREKKR